MARNSSVLHLALGLIGLTQLCLLGACSTEEGDVRLDAIQEPGSVSMSLSANAPVNQLPPNSQVWHEGDEMGVFAFEGGSNSIYRGYDNCAYVTNAGDGAFDAKTDADVIYYPSDGSKLDFVAYAPYRASLQSDGNKRLFTVPDWNDQKNASSFDLLISKRSEDHSMAVSEQQVDLVMLHQFSKLIFNVYTDVDEYFLDPTSLSELEVSATNMNVSTSVDVITGEITHGSAVAKDIVFEDDSHNLLTTANHARPTAFDNSSESTITVNAGPDAYTFIGAAYKLHGYSTSPDPSIEYWWEIEDGALIIIENPYVLSTRIFCESAGEWVVTLYARVDGEIIASDSFVLCCINPAQATAIISPDYNTDSSDRRIKFDLGDSGHEYYWSVPKGQKFAAGQSYTYKVVLRGDRLVEVTLVATIKDWNNHNVADVELTEGILVSSIVAPDDMRLPIGAKQQVSARVLPEDADNKALEWSSSNPAVATVTQNGLISCLSVGTTVISVTAKDGSGVSDSFVVECYNPVVLVSSITVPADMELPIGTNKQISVTVKPSNATNPAVSWSSSSPAVASIDQNGNLSCLTVGTTTITVKAKDGSGVKNTFVVKCVTPEINGHEYVDLGLPSGLKWAKCNMGASKESDYGYCYPWGGTMSKSPYNSFSSDLKKWGGTWRVPTMSEFAELKNNCTYKWYTSSTSPYNKIAGAEFSRNGKSVFFPAAGYTSWSTSGYTSRGTEARYWSSTARSGYVFTSSGIAASTTDQYRECPYRLVSP